MVLHVLGRTSTVHFVGMGVGYFECRKVEDIAQRNNTTVIQYYSSWMTWVDVWKKVE